MLKILIALADAVSKFSFFRASGPCQRGEKIIFRYNNGYKQRLDPLGAKRRQLSNPFSWARVEMRSEEEKNNGKGNSTSAPSRVASVSEGKMQFWQKDTLVKPNKLQTGLLHLSKVSLRFSVLKLLNMNIEIKPIPSLFISLTANNHFWYCCPLFGSDLCTIPSAML